MSTQKIASKDTPTSEIIPIASTGTEMGALVYPVGATALQASSGNVGAATATATLTSAAAKTAYLSGFQVTGLGATTGVAVPLTITGLLGGSLVYNVAVPAGVLVGIAPLVVSFNPPLPASAVNTNIVCTLTSFGSGNTNAAVSAQGLLQ